MIIDTDDNEFYLFKESESRNPRCETKIILVKKKYDNKNSHTHAWKNFIKH